MEQTTEFGGSSKLTPLESLPKEELIKRYTIVVDELSRVIKENYLLRNQKISDSQLTLIMEEQLEELRNTIFGASSERYKKPNKPKEPKAPPKPRIKKPSERYPNIPVREELVPFDEVPTCDACGKVMQDSGMTEESEQLTVIPKKHEIIRYVRPKFRCSCHGCIKTAPPPPRIIEGSSYSDEMILDVVLSKYCDLIPIERYVAMASRGGLMDLPPQSLILLTHGFADFVIGAYQKLKDQVLMARVLHADETPHRMLEGSDTKHWYLWGFSTPSVCYLECHDTRSGVVASDILLNSRCERLLTDVFSGYGKAVREANEVRAKNHQPLILNANCNAHARRYFFKARTRYTRDAEFYLDHYHEIYELNSKSQGKDPPGILELRSQMVPHFEAMKAKAMEGLSQFPQGSKLAKGMSYLLENDQGLTLFLKDPEIPIDNNSQERLLRSHVVGRKTWYGTHSERGATTAAVLFSLVESCKLNDVNPRVYFKNLVQDLLARKNPYTPKEFKELQKN